MAALSYIPQGVENIYSKYADYYRTKGSEDLMREGMVSRRRTSDVLPEALSKYNLEYGLGTSKSIKGSEDNIGY